MFLQITKITFLQTFAVKKMSPKTMIEKNDFYNS